jgi:hypothetical protein
MTDNPMTVGELRELLPEPGSTDYNLPVKVYAAMYSDFEIPEYSFRERDADIDCINKISELTKPDKDFFRIEIV